VVSTTVPTAVNLLFSRPADSFHSVILSDSVPDPLLLKNLVTPEVELGTSVSVARNSSH
jgi:hypothetical protein